MRREKPAVLNFVKIWKKLFILFSIVAIPGIMVCLVFAFMKAMAFWIIAPAAILIYLTVYAVYALHISMGAAIGFEATDKVVHVITKRKTYTYDVKRGCVDVKVTKRKFVCTFETQNSRDKFTFYRRVMFAKRYEEQFTPEEIASFYPRIDEMDIP